jgi:hypothetical protein
MGAPKSKNDQDTAKSSAKTKEVVKKVRPFPFPAQIILKEGTPPVAVDIMKLSELGFLMQTRGSQIFKVGSEMFVDFEIPVLHLPVKSKVKVIKTYDIMATNLGEAKLEKRYTVEMHFKMIPLECKDYITRFLKKIGAKK